MARLTRLSVPGPPAAWRALGFHLDREVLRVADVDVRTGAEQPSWDFDALNGDPAPLGVSTGTHAAPEPAAPSHPNGVDGVDHVVYAVPDLDVAVGHLQEILGLDLRKRAKPRGEAGPEMAFFRAGSPVIEVVAAGAGPALWGLALRAPDLDVTVAAVRAAGGPIGDPKPSIQGGRIATVPTAHTGLRLAVMEPRPR